MFLASGVCCECAASWLGAQVLCALWHTVPMAFIVFGGFMLTGKKLHLPMNAGRPFTAPIAGAHAEITGEIPGARSTVTRVAAGAALAGPVGALIGGMAKKDTSKIIVTVALADGRQVWTQGPKSDYSSAMFLVDKINKFNEK